MGSLVSKALVDVTALPDGEGGFFQIVFLGCAYAYILFYGSGLINKGSELLLLIPSVSRLVGSIVNPVLSGVPDATLVLFSGLGSDPRTELGIGMGSLSGSNVFLLTVPWALAVITGRVKLNGEGEPLYVAPDGWPSGQAFRKLDTPKSLVDTGVRCARSVRNSAIVMVITAVPYLFLEIPSAVNGCFLRSQVDEGRCSIDSWSTLVGGIVAGVLFIAYLVIQVLLPPSDVMNQERIDQLRREAVRDHLITIRGLFPNRFVDSDGVVPVVPESRRFQRCLLPFFREFDINHTGYMDRCNFSLLLSQIGERPSPQQLDILMRAVDLDGKGRISFMDFARCVAQIINDPKYLIRTGRVSFISTRSSEVSGLSRARRSGSSILTAGRTSSLGRGSSAARAAALAKFRAAQVANNAGDGAEQGLRDGDQSGDNIPLPDTPRAHHSHNEPFGCSTDIGDPHSSQLDDRDYNDEEEHILMEEHIVHTPRPSDVIPSPTTSMTINGRPLPPTAAASTSSSVVVHEPAEEGVGSPLMMASHQLQGPPSSSTPDSCIRVAAGTAANYGADLQADHDAHLRSVLASGLNTPSDSEKSVYSVDPPLEDGEFEDDGEEDVSVPDSIAHLSPKEQQRRIIRSAVTQICGGLLLVFIFSDAIVQVFSEVAVRIGVEPFYVAFTLAPFISNASVIIAAYSYGIRKTEKSVSVAFASLIGSVCVNNTLSLAVFGMLLYLQDLPWTYSSETFVVLTVEVIACVMCVLFRVHKWWFGVVFLLLFPASVGVVAGLQAVGVQ